MARATSKKTGGAAGAAGPEVGQTPGAPPKPARVGTRGRRVAAVPAPDPGPAGSAPPVAGRGADDRPAALDGLARAAGETRARLDMLRTEVEETRRELAEARRQALAALDEWGRALGAAAAARDQSGRQAAELAGHLRAARAESEGLSRALGEARAQLARVPDPGPAAGSRSEPAEGPPPDAAGKNRLGVTVGPGVVVAEVRADAPAGAAGLAPGDVIEGVNGRPVHSGGELREAVHAVAAGGEAALRIVRAGSATEVMARRGAPADGAADGPDWLGVTVEPGAVVAEVLPDSPAAVAGLRPGDVITRVNDDPVGGGDQLRAVIRPLLPRAEVGLRLTRGARVRDVKVRLDDPPPAP